MGNLFKPQTPPPAPAQSCRDFATQRMLNSMGGQIYVWRTDPDAINVPYGAKTQCHKILRWLAGGRTLSAWTLVAELRSTSGPARGREVRSWLRSHGFKIQTKTVKQPSGARVLFFWLSGPDRLRLRDILKQSKESK